MTLTQSVIDDRCLHDLMVYRYIPDLDRYGGYNKDEALENAELPPNRELRDDE